MKRKPSIDLSINLKPTTYRAALDASLGSVFLIALHNKEWRLAEIYDLPKGTGRRRELHYHNGEKVFHADVVVMYKLREDLI